MSGRLLSCYAPAAIFFLFLFATLSLVEKPDYVRLPHGRRPGAFGEASKNHFQDKDIIHSLNLTRTFDYRRRCIIAKPTKGLASESLAELPGPLLGSGTEMRLNWFEDGAQEEHALPPCEETITLKVPQESYNPHPGTETLMLGVATFLERISASLPEMSRWLSNTGTHLLVMLRDEPDDINDAMLDAVLGKAESLNIRITLLRASNQGEAQSNFELANAFHTHREPQTQWFGVIDDDTFFVSLPKLLTALSPYDPSVPWYIGGLSERHWGVGFEGFKAWGGAGIFMSPPLLETISNHSEECMAMAGIWGDVLWRDCLRKVTTPTVHFTQLLGLNQLDMYDAVGWYESGPSPLLTVHHWKSWFRFPVHIAHLVTDVSGVDTFLQRYKASDDMILSNGFSLVQYPNGLPDLRLVEGTMYPYPEPENRNPDEGSAYLDSLGSLRPALEEGKDKISWRLKYATKTANGCVRQFYLKLDPDVDEDQGDASKWARRDEDFVSSVVEIDWCK